MRGIALGLMLAGCGGGGTATSGDMATLPPPAVFTQANTSDPATKMPANFGCGTKVDPPAPTTPTTQMVIVDDFQTNAPVAGAVVEVYGSMDALKAGTPAATSAPTDNKGQTMLTVPAGSYRVIYRTTGGPDTIETLELDRAYDDHARVLVSKATKAAIPGLVQVVQADGMGVIGGSLRDCDEKEVGGVSVMTTPPSGSFDAAANTFYFVDVGGGTTVPVRAQKWTTGEGVFAVLNVPPGDVSVAARGALGESAALSTLSAATVPVRANAVTVIQLEPRAP